MESRLRRYAQIAFKEAQKSVGHHRLGAIVIGSGGRILGKGHNDYDRCKHAEVAAIKKVPQQHLEDSVLMVVRLRKTQPLGMAKPCPNCMAYIKSRGIKRVYFSDEFGNIQFTWP